MVTKDELTALSAELNAVRAELWAISVDVENYGADTVGLTQALCVDINNRLAREMAYMTELTRTANAVREELELHGLTSFKPVTGSLVTRLYRKLKEYLKRK